MGHKRGGVVYPIWKLDLAHCGKCWRNSGCHHNRRFRPRKRLSSACNLHNQHGHHYGWKRSIYRTTMRLRRKSFRTAVSQKSNIARTTCNFEYDHRPNSFYRRCNRRIQRYFKSNYYAARKRYHISTVCSQCDRWYYHVSLQFTNRVCSIYGRPSTCRY